MSLVSRLDNPIQTYSWGSRTALAEFLGGASPSPEPQAELWMGAHPQAPSRVRVGETWQPLCELIAGDPEGLLGRDVTARLGPELPFLFKVLAVAAPLSLQAHPAAEQARRGFEREERAGVPRNAPQRDYRDPHHKPEMVCALTRFTGLKGFRPAREILASLRALKPSALGAEIEQLAEAPDPEGLQSFFGSLFRLDPARRARLVAELADKAERSGGAEEAFRWVVRLANGYPGDVGVLAPLLLHVVHLEPGEAMFLPAGELHCYLDGLASELMANSDNVLRGGLTAKHVNPDELLRVLRFEPAKPEILRPEGGANGESRYPVLAPEFALSELRLAGDAPIALDPRGAEILLCVQGSAEIREAESGRCQALPRGASVFVPARCGRLELHGEARLQRARVPDPTECRWPSTT